MPNIEIPLTSGQYLSTFDFGNRQFSFNMFPNHAEAPGSLTPTKVQPPAGYEEFSSGAISNSGPYQGFAINPVAQSEQLYAYWNEVLYSISALGTVTAKDVNTVSTQGYAKMAWNRVDIMATTKGGDAYFYDETTTTNAPITDANFVTLRNGQPMAGVVYLDGYFIFATRERLFVSSLETVNRGRDFNTLDFIVPAYGIGDIVDLQVVDNLLWVIKAFSIEVYQNTGAANFPFSRVQSFTFDRGGSVTGRSIAVGDELYMLGRGQYESWGVYRVSGGRMEKISNDYIDGVLAQSEIPYSAFDQTISQKIFAVSHDGRFFIGFSQVINGGRSYFYDITESARVGFPVWHRRGRTDGAGQDRYFGLDGVQLYDRNLLLGQYSSGPEAVSAVCEFTPGVFTELGQDRVRYVSGAYLTNGSREVKVAKIFSRFKKNPGGNIYLSYSDDRVFSLTSMDSGIAMDSGFAEWRRFGQARSHYFLLANSSDLVTPAPDSQPFIIYELKGKAR